VSVCVCVYGSVLPLNTYILDSFFQIRIKYLHMEVHLHLFYPKRLRKSRFVERDRNTLLWYMKIRTEQVSSNHNCKVNRMSFIIVACII